MKEVKNNHSNSRSKICQSVYQKYLEIIKKASPFSKEKDSHKKSNSSIIKSFLIPKSKSVNKNPALLKNWSSFIWCSKSPFAKESSKTNIALKTKKSPRELNSSRDESKRKLRRRVKRNASKNSTRSMNKNWSSYSTSKISKPIESKANEATSALKYLLYLVQFCILN